MPLSTDGYQMPPITAEPDRVVPLGRDERSVVQHDLGRCRVQNQKIFRLSTPAGASIARHSLRPCLDEGRILAKLAALRGARPERCVISSQRVARMRAR